MKLRLSPFGPWLALILVCAALLSACSQKAEDTAKQGEPTVTQTGEFPKEDATLTEKAPEEAKEAEEPEITAKVGEAAKPEEEEKAETAAKAPAGTPVATNGPVTLKLAPASGTKFKVKIDSTAEMPGMGGAQPQKMETSMVQAFNLLSSSGGKSNWRMTIESVDAGGNAGAEQAKGMTVEASFDSRGQGSNFKVIKGAAGMTDAIIQTVTGQAGTGFLGVMYPAKAVKLGESWTQNLDIKKLLGSAMPPEMNVTGDVKQTYTLRKIENRNGKQVALIDTKLSGTVKIKLPQMPRDPNSKAPPPPSEIPMQLSSDGTAVVELATGLLLESDQESSVKLEMMGQKLDQKQTSTVRRV